MLSSNLIDQRNLVRVRRIAEVTGLSPETIRRYRYRGLLKENLHWITINPRLVLYVEPLVVDWFLNQNDQIAHQRAIENYLSKLPSNQRKG
ncbi:MAG: hypothetical protein NW224_28155 [Leptolyngbyaceae cyanobacterium bins.302]|nr:hypothetical protein [Leptolyngbyaceae cyanobacterium bins.302]